MVGDIDALVFGAGASLSTSDRLTSLAEHDPKVLVRVLQSVCSSIEAVSRAHLLKQGVQITDPVRQMAAREADDPAVHAARAAWESADRILEKHRDASTIFVKDGDLFFADDSFRLERVSLAQVNRDVSAAKAFVYRYGKRVMVG